MFSRQHYNVIAKVMRENFPTGQEPTYRLNSSTIRGAVADVALDLAKRFKADNENFDPLRFLDACSPDTDCWPLSKLWEDGNE